ncbi:GEVED domain-containing protein [Epilithonimonas xixisoli]|uniref:Putative secreted protein (Por secretion system target) n=1 Tax=Epilithonimonas xixisoli TaxID=1476462 RepID=A0A4R8IDX4_9FLAO|nr:GEVED domain-containing protein [Epilithonimonas xixisoli]TDX83005.1 putative secreted protein (Por secretion system target) [Epilithonimonas xixisoli]
MKKYLFFNQKCEVSPALKTLLFSFFILFFGNVWGQVTLPHTRTVWNSTPSGWTDTPLDSYTTSFACSGDNGAKFDTSGDSKIVFLDSSPDKLSFTVKSNTSTTSSLLIQESDDGTTYTSVINMSGSTDLPTSCTPKGAYQLKATTRFIRWTFTKGSSNMTMDDVSITKLISTCTSPSTQASVFSSSAGTQTTATASWTRGSGDRVLVLAKSGSAVDADPASGNTYTANATFGSGTQIGAGNYVVYDGTGTSVNLTGLATGTNYHFAVYEYNSTGTCYNLTKLTGNLTTASAPSVTASGTLNEATLNGATVNLTLNNTTFADATLSAANFTLGNAPAGVSIQSITYNSATSATVTLAYDNTDFDTNVTNFNVIINGSELTSVSNLTSNNLTVTAVTETLTLSSGNLAFGTVCNGSFGDQSFTISGTNLKAGTINFSAIAGYTYSETLGGSAITGFSHLGGTLATKTIYVRLTPTASNQTYNGTITVSGGAAPNVTKNVSGNSNITAQSVTTDINSANNVDYRSANLRASATTLGVCSASIERGFVYSITALNSSPVVLGSNVSKLVETATLASNAYAENTGNVLAEGTTYSYRAYIFDGTNYVYGLVQTFTTTFNGNLNTVTNTTACLTDDGGTIKWTAPASGVTPTGYMVFAVASATTPSGALTNALGDYSNADSNFSAVTNSAVPSSLGKLLYKGNPTSLSVNITGLTENQNYSFLVLAYQDGGTVRRFNTAADGGRALNVIAQDDVRNLVPTVGTNQVTLNWNVPLPSSCWDQLIIVANQGSVTFTPSGSYTNGDFGYVANGVAYATSTSVSSKTIAGLTNGLNYCFKIFVRRGSVWSDGVEVCAIPVITYCESQGTTPDPTGITRVRFNTIDNTSTSTNAYSPYTSISTTLLRGGSYSLNVNVNTDGFQNYTKAWIDWNQDGDFNDAGEDYDLGDAFTGTNELTSLSPLNITVPSTATLGNTRMRVATQYYNSPSIPINLTPCGTYAYGEVEDYTITITQPANAEINIKGGGNNIPNEADTPYPFNNTILLSTALGSDSPEKEFIIENLGLANLNLTGTPIINIVGANASDFIVTQQAVSPVVNGVNTSFKILFRPTAAGIREADVSIANDDSDENPYTFRIQGTGTCSTASVSIAASPASGPANTIVTFTSSINNLSTATITYNGATVSPISATTSKLEVAVPAGALDANFIVTLANGCNFTHTFDVTTSDLTSCEATSGGSSTASDLVIYEVYDVKTGSGGLVTIFNRTGVAVNLSTYSIQRSRDHNDLPNEPYYTYANLSGTLAAGAVAVIGVNDESSCNYTSILTGNGSFGATGFNADDGLRLMNGSTVVDVVHAPNTTGYYLRRKNENLSPSTTFVSSQWTNQFLVANQCLSDVGQAPVVKIAPVVNTHPSYTLSCEVDNSSMTISATEGVAGGLGLTYQWYVLPSSGTSWTAVANGGVYSGATSETLNISDITGLNNYQYYCQVRENTATCFTATNAAQIKEANNTWTTSNVWSNGTPILASKVIIAGNYDTQVNGALDVCALTVNSTGTVMVKPNHPIKVKKKITNSNTTLNSFVVESDANLIQVDNIVNEGAIKVERNVVNMNNQATGTGAQVDYVYWSSPVFEQLIKGVNGFSPNTPSTGYQQYNEANDKFVTTPDTYFQAGKGYSIRAENVLANGYNKTYSFTGVPNNGDITSPALTRSAGADKGYNLVGNPYPSNMNFDTFYALNSSKMYNTAWFWTNITYISTQMGSGYTGNNYAVYNGTGGVPPAFDHADYDPENPSGIIPNGNVKVGQGFIVQVKASTSLDFNNGMRVTDNGTFYQKGAAKNRFWLTMRSPKNMVNTILLGYIPGATNGFETDFDGELFVVGSDSFYSVLGAKKLAIQGKDGNFSNEDVVTLGNAFSVDGTYTIGLQTPEGIFNGTQNIFLKDKLLNKYINLSTETSYTFTAVKGVDATRFEIVYKESSVLGNDETSKSDFIVYRDRNTFVVKSSKKLGRVEIYDTGGRLVRQLSSKENTLTIDASDLPNAVYIIKAENSGDIKTKKIIK